MQFFIVVLLISFLFFLFFVYVLSKDDLVLIRFNISLEKVFNISFIVGLGALFAARFFYILVSGEYALFNPFLFTLFTYFPGLSLTGGVLGGALFLSIWSRIAKVSFSRLFDIFAISFLFSMLPGIPGYFFLSDKNLLSIEFAVNFAAYLAFFIFFIKVVVAFSERGRIKTGGIGYIFVILFSALTFTFNILFKEKIFDLENVILGISAIVSLIIFFGPETIHGRPRLRGK